MATAVTPGVRWNAAAPARLFQVGPSIQNYDVVPDGSRFLVVLPVEQVAESPLRVILNWTAALKAEK